MCTYEPCAYVCVCVSIFLQPVHKAAGDFQHLAPVEARGQPPRWPSMCSAQASNGPDHQHAHTHIHTNTPCFSWAAPVVYGQLLNLPDGVRLDWIHTSCQTDSYPRQRDHQHGGRLPLHSLAFPQSHAAQKFLHFLSLLLLFSSVYRPWPGPDAPRWAQRTGTEKCWSTTLCHFISFLKSMYLNTPQRKEK